MVENNFNKEYCNLWEKVLFYKKYNTIDLVNFIKIPGRNTNVYWLIQENNYFNNIIFLYYVDIFIQQ